ncbi:phage tail protein [Aeromonas salmonicida]|uniref:phage tail-collar fiber domain-containing protein n=1 Tax=Aeromonas salmonicida TaxID=645 RepID=UPI0038BCD699
MSQVITNAFEQYWQSSLAAEQPVVLDEFILADIPNLDITSPIDPDTGLPPESQIVHRQNVDQRGRINNNAVAYTIVMDTTVGDFSFNAMYLRNKQNGVIGMIVYKGRETKLKTDQTTGQTGNSLVKSMLMGYDQAAEATLTHVDAGTWQIDYAARLRGQDEDLRQLANQLYGHHTFIGDGFKVVQQDGGHQVTSGVAIIGGLRIELKQPQVIYPGTKPIGVWVDVHRSGSLLSEHQNHFTIITSVADLTDHVDSNGYPHYVAKLATVQADSTVIDGRGQGGNSGNGGIPDTFIISVLDEGAIANSTNGLDGADSTAAFLSSIAKCKATGKSLSIPKQLGGYRLTQCIDVRNINVLESDATIYINHVGIGVIFGGNASNPNNPRQSFGTVIRVTGAAGRVTPDMRGIGVKGQHIHVERCEYLQLYANDLMPNKATDYSCAYSTLTLKKVDTIELYGEPGSIGWINENIFHMNRTNKIRFVDGQYHHNHNKFYHGTMEGLGLIDLPIGSNNYFYGLRFEREGAKPADTLTINFGHSTWNNIVEETWKSSPGYSNEPYDPLGTQVIINDLGRGNAVCHGQDAASDEVAIFSLTENTPFVSSANYGNVGLFSNNTDLHGVRHIQHLIDGRFKCKSNFAPLLMDDRTIPVRNGDMLTLYADAALFRPVVFLYDLAGNLILTEPTDDEALYMPGKVWNTDGYYSLAANTGRAYMIIGAGISAIRMQINTGAAVSGKLFKFLRVTARFYKDATNGNRKAFGIKDASRKGAMSYFDGTDINMANIAEGLPCYKNDMTEMKINHLRQRYVVKSVAGNIITVAGAAVQYFDIASASVAYTANADNVTVPVSSVSGMNITLSNSVPADIVAGSNIDLMITKTKVLA